MTTAAEVLSHAMALPPGERAGIVRSLIESLPDGPTIYRTEAQLAAELNRRLERIESGQETFFDASETIRRAREALRGNSY